ncbi:hypothetical protein [Nicoliella lavandulae]|uniref:Uncharacterized protein n=1 Tax=Nicoliella lavandulae TaxID=3082954 RepID=A0ABU8SMA4_9LACO
MAKLHHNRIAVDQRNKHKNFFGDQLPKYISSQIHCMELARVKKYDTSTHKCELVPLALQSDDDKRANLLEVEVPYDIWHRDEVLETLVKDYDSRTHSKLKWEKLKKGSVVLVGFMDRDTDNFTGSATNYKIKPERMHSLNDSIVLGVYKP